MKPNTAITPDSKALIARIREAMRYKNISITAVAKEAGMCRPTVTNQLSGYYNLDIRVVLAVARLCQNVSADYILRGNGELLSPQQSALETRISRIEKLLEKRGNKA